MKHATKFAPTAIAIAFALVGTAVQAAIDPKLVESCNDCHGANGASGAQDVPTIAGVSALVQSDSLKAYKSKSRPCPKVNLKRGDTQRQGDMCTVAKDLTDAVVADLAAYYASQKYVAMKQPFDAAKASAGKAIHDRDCKKCHSSGGKDPADDAGILAGQPLTWLKTALTSLTRGESEQPKKMKDVVAKLTDADNEALAHYYASEQ